MRVKDIEIATHVPKKFRFPLFTKWVVYSLQQRVADVYHF